MESDPAPDAYEERLRAAVRNHPALNFPTWSPAEFAMMRQLVEDALAARAEVPSGPFRAPLDSFFEIVRAHQANPDH